VAKGNTATFESVSDMVEVCSCPYDTQWSWVCDLSGPSSPCSPLAE
jgi:hypothetical protein